MKTMGIDYGTVRVGIALSYGDTIAEPEIIFENNEELLNNISKLCDRERVKKIVVGISEKVMAEKSMKFAEEIKRALKLPVELMDETLSSHEIGELMKAKTLKQRRQPIDHLAAALILQNYLDSQPKVWPTT